MAPFTEHIVRLTSAPDCNQKRTHLPPQEFMAVSHGSLTSPAIADIEQHDSEWSNVDSAGCGEAPTPGEFSYSSEPESASEEEIPQEIVQLNELRDCEYRPLEPGTIRLIRLLTPTEGDSLIRCELFDHDVLSNAAVRYTALSYCWGDPEQTRSIVVNGLRLNVTQNLWKALRAIRDHHSNPENDFFWIDAISINQQDMEERSEQVQQMWRIFSEAERTFAWLGPEEQHLEKILDTAQESFDGCTEASQEFHIKDYDKYHDCSPLPQVLKREEVPIKTILRNSYFQRTWIMQEYTQSRNLHFLCGSLSISRAMLSHYVDTLKLDSSLKNFRYLDESRSDQKSSLDGLLNLFYDSECSDVRDRVFAMIGHSWMRKLDPESRLRVDYSLEQHELVLLVLEWYDIIDQEQTGESQDVWTVGVCYSLTRALKVLWEFDTLFSEWLTNFADVRVDQAANKITLASGREIDCSGPVWKKLFDYVPFNARKWEDSNRRAALLQRRPDLRDSWAITGHLRPGE